MKASRFKVTNFLQAEIDLMYSFEMYLSGLLRFERLLAQGTLESILPDMLGENVPFDIRRLRLVATRKAAVQAT